ncbi:PepSY domain-containing protein [Acetobacter sp.]|uniref:PepSY domain-containing protein n=1 Tax=Acetobacter sp. TaxID=440 RepID=UPI0039E95335
MTTRTLRRWFVVHKWTSLVCTLFLLIVCVTGLPLLFSEQIWDTFVGDDDPPYEVLPAGMPNASLDVIVEKARSLYPGQIITSVNPDDDEPAVLISMAPSWQALKDDETYPDRHSGHWIKFDARTAKVLEQSRPADALKEPRTWTGIIMGSVIVEHEMQLGSVDCQRLLAHVTIVGRIHEASKHQAGAGVVR